MAQALSMPLKNIITEAENVIHFSLSPTTVAFQDEVVTVMYMRTLSFLIVRGGRIFTYKSVLLL